jgi:hypothetical protein
MLQNANESFDAYQNRLSQVFAGLEVLGSGRTRITFAISDEEVFKVAHCVEGLSDNALEARRCEADDLGFPLAECRIETINGIEGLVMERVEPMWANFPKWASRVDDNQVGLTQWGQVVAFDFGDF